MARHEHTHGGLSGHLLRRSIHIATILIPIIYYHWGGEIAPWFGISRETLLIIILLIILAFEFVRIWCGWKIFGQRFHEFYQLSSMAWGFFGIVLVLLFAPKPIYAYALIISYALGDPFLGELRHSKLPRWSVMILAMIFIALIWWILGIWEHFPLWLPLLMGFFTVLVEWPKFRWIDDNFLMLVLPLILINLLEIFI